MAPLDPDSSSPTIENKLDASQSPYTMDALPTTAAPLPLQERSQSLSAKRPRNADDRLLIPPCTIPSDLAPVATFVDKAIGAPALTPYRSIVDCVKRRNDANLLHRLLIVFRVNGSTLHQLMTFPKQHAQLLHSIFRLDPFFVPSKMVDDEDFNKLVKSFELAYAHLHLCVAMVSANSTFLQPALNCLWKLLTTTKNANEDLTEGRVKCVHAALSTILRLVPKGATDLFPIMSSGFPFRIRPHLKEYSEHCLSVLEYAPTLEAQVLELLIDKALEMDVEIKIKSSGDVEIDDEKFVKPSDDDDAIFDLEMDDTALHQEMQSKKEESKSLAERRIDEMADKVRRSKCMP
jgi:RNA polymerase I-specific transcription initiation factor RRN3